MQQALSTAVPGLPAPCWGCFCFIRGGAARPRDRAPNGAAFRHAQPSSRGLPTPGCSRRAPRQSAFTARSAPARCSRSWRASWCKTSGVADVLPPRAGPGADPGGVRLRLGGRRKERAGSDVDLMVIGELIRAGRQAVASRAEVLGREISPAGYSVKGGRNAARRMLSCATCSPPRIFVMGGERELG